MRWVLWLILLIRMGKIRTVLDHVFETFGIKVFGISGIGTGSHPNSVISALIVKHKIFILPWKCAHCGEGTQTDCRARSIPSQCMGSSPLCRCLWKFFNSFFSKISLKFYSVLMTFGWSKLHSRLMSTSDVRFSFFNAIHWSRYLPRNTEDFKKFF